jgi:hypothetical protein
MSAIPVIKPRLRTAVADKKGERASRYMRNIDATRFDEASELVLHQQLTGPTSVLRWQPRTRPAPARRGPS